LKQFGSISSKDDHGSENSIFNPEKIKKLAKDIARSIQGNGGFVKQIHRIVILGGKVLFH
jgi:hypoxanthine-guanine phosphoribosyltransferase